MRKIKVSDVMIKNVVTLSPSDTLNDAFRLMNRKKIGSIPIVENDKAVGIITLYDLKQYHYLDYSKILIKEVMSTNLSFVSEDSDTSEAKNIMDRRHIRSVIVADENRILKGLITSKDIQKLESKINMLQYSSTYKNENHISNSSNNILKYMFFGIIFLILIWLVTNLNSIVLLLHISKNCTDGTLYESCSSNKPLYCSNGTLENKADVCGCHEDFMAVGDNCSKIQRCTDGTIYEECSVEKPFYCSNGTLIKQVSLCGCMDNEVINGSDCISKYLSSPKDIELRYILRGKKDSIKFTVYGGLSDSLPIVSRYNCNPYPCFIGKGFQLEFIDNENQKKFLSGLVEDIKNKKVNKDDQARIAISLVQNIPYDYAKENLNGGDFDERYPYQVLYDQKGLCGEKSKLLVFLLRELGFGTAFISDIGISHTVVGIKCPQEFSYQESGYCFIETADPAIITNSDIDYKGLRFTNPIFTPINEGSSLDSVSEEYNDAQEWNNIQKMIMYPGQQVDQTTYNTWFNLVQKYCIQTSGNECTMN